MSDSFADRWLKKERELGLDGQPESLIAYGELRLPLSAAPFLGFAEFAKQPRIWEVFGNPERWPNDERHRLGEIRMIGSDGAGNPICIRETDGTIQLLDHEDNFHTVTFVNSSIPHLAECLLSFMGERDPTRFRSAVLAIDAAAMGEKTFWWHEANFIQSDEA